MAAYKLIGQDSALTVALGGSALGGAAPTYGAGLDLHGIAMEWGIEEDLETVNVAAQGDSRRKVRAKRAGTVISIKGFVLSTGCTYQGMIGQYAQVTPNELSTLGSPPTYAGVITKWHWTSPDNEQVEEIEITCDADHA